MNHVNDCKTKQWAYIHVFGLSVPYNFTKDSSRNFVPFLFILYIHIPAFKVCYNSKLALIYAGKCL